MSVFIESLKRLYKAGKVTVEKLDTLKTEEKISQEEYDYIAAQ